MTMSVKPRIFSRYFYIFCLFICEIGVTKLNGHTILKEAYSQNIWCLYGLYFISFKAYTEKNEKINELHIVINIR